MVEQNKEAKIDVKYEIVSDFQTEPKSAKIMLGVLNSSCELLHEETNESASKKDEGGAWQQQLTKFVDLEFFYLDFTWKKSVKFEKSDFPLPCNLILGKNSPTSCIHQVWFKGKLITMLVGSVQSVFYYVEDIILQLKECLYASVRLGAYLLNMDHNRQAFSGREKFYLRLYFCFYRSLRARIF